MRFSYFIHPENVCMSYIKHLCLSMNFSKKLFISSIKAFIHAIIPSLYITSTSDLVDELKIILNTVGCRN